MPAPTQAAIAGPTDNAGVSGELELIAAVDEEILEPADDDYLEPWADPIDAWPANLQPIARGIRAVAVAWLLLQHGDRVADVVRAHAEELAKIVREVEGAADLERD